MQMHMDDVIIYTVKGQIAGGHTTLLISEQNGRHIAHAYFFHGRFVNGNLAEYHVPVNADVQSIQVDFVEENDTAFNPLGGRGIGEIGITGVAAAVANAAWHATGKRIRDLPITLDKLL